MQDVVPIENLILLFLNFFIQMEKFYFTFGQEHRHVDKKKRVCDSNTIICIRGCSAMHAKEKMFENFDDKWAFQYPESELKDLLLCYSPTVKIYEL